MGARSRVVAKVAGFAIAFGAGSKATTRFGSGIATVASRAGFGVVVVAGARSG